LSSPRHGIYSNYQVDRDVFESDAVSEDMKRELVAIHLKSIDTGLQSNYRKAGAGGTSKCRMFFVRAGCHYKVEQSGEEWVWVKLDTTLVKELLKGTSTRI
jgi:hypothetical protein